MKVLVTGHKGYIGPHLVQLLKEAGHYVIGYDLDLFTESCISKLPVPDIEVKQDIRHITAKELEGIDCIMHLAAISNDPMGNMNPDITYSINKEGSIRLAQLAKQAGVKRFFFSSSCSIYGKGELPDLDETASLNPITAYAVSKIATEEALQNMADDHFSPVYLRNSTAYGFSPLFRIDLVVNNLLACAIAKGDIRIMSDGRPWRPLIHCKDIARAFVAMLDAPMEKIHNQAINIGEDKENYQVKDVADKVQKLIPKANIIFTGEIGVDPRDYRVSFKKLNTLLPDFQLEYTLESGMEELFYWLKKINFSASDFESDRFIRLKLLQKHLSMLQ